MKPLVDKYLPLDSNTTGSSLRHAERQKDHYSHFILRLAFASTEDLRRRFSRVESMLFRLQFLDEKARERQAFVESLDFGWEIVGNEEKLELASSLVAAGGGFPKRLDEESWYKVDWERVPELVESRRVLVRQGKAYVPSREQLSMVLAEFTARLDRALELTSRALPRLDEDDRLTPILNHLSSNFTTPSSTFSSSSPLLPGATITATSIDSLSTHFPLCMGNLHHTLRRDAHLKHQSRLQYTLFLKGIGLSLEECLLFWRTSFSKITDDTFNKEYRYNVRHAYGDVGGDSNRRGRGYAPFSCQKILTEHPPGPGQAHGCPYRHFSLDNLMSLVQSPAVGGASESRVSQGASIGSRSSGGGGGGITDPAVLKGIKEDIAKTKYHLACNRVFEHLHAKELKRAKESGEWSAGDLETIVHPNEYFKRSFLLMRGGKEVAAKMEEEE